MLTIEQVKENGWLIFEAIAGSKAYGLATEKSDTDIRGVYVLPRELFYSLEYVPQVSNESNDIVYYELRRFIELLSKNNPNIMELLAIPDSFILQRHPVMDMVRAEIFLSRLCEKTFANYAFTQIRKAMGLEKKILNPVEKERRSVLDFCFVYRGQEVLSLDEFLKLNKYRQEDLGLTALPHLRDCYNVYYKAGGEYAGLMKKENANEVSLSHIPKGEAAVGVLYFNKDGYSVYCRQYKEYWDWVGKRNEDRYLGNRSHGKAYDSKNMMHVFRLLYMAREIATEKSINVQRTDRAFLLDIRAGKYEYDQLLEMAEELKNELGLLYEVSGLPDAPDIGRLNNILIAMRESLYSAGGVWGSKIE